MIEGLRSIFPGLDLTTSTLFLCALIGAVMLLGVLGSFLWQKGLPKGGGVVAIIGFAMIAWPATKTLELSSDGTMKIERSGGEESVRYVEINKKLDSLFTQVDSTARDQNAEQRGTIGDRPHFFPEGGTIGRTIGDTNNRGQTTSLSRKQRIA